jgi:membrane protein DedA with SNARE-associated domain
VTTEGSRPVAHRRRDLVWVLLGVFALALIAVKVSNLFDLHLPWLYAVAAAVNVAIVMAYVSRERRR